MGYNKAEADKGLVPIGCQSFFMVYKTKNMQ